MDSGQPARGLDAVQLRHGDVHDDHVGMQFLGQLHGFAAVAGLAHDLHVGLRGEDHAEALAHQRVIVGEQNSIMSCDLVTLRERRPHFDGHARRPVWM